MEGKDQTEWELLPADGGEPGYLSSQAARSTRTSEVLDDGGVAVVVRWVEKIVSIPKTAALVAQRCRDQVKNRLLVKAKL
jgi:hypothetical protein